MKRFEYRPTSTLQQRIARVPRRGIARMLAVVVALLILLSGAAGPTAVARAGLPLNADGVPTLAPLIDQATPAVVNIAVSSRAPAQQNPLLQDPFFRRFFDAPENAPERDPGPQRRGAGSGVIVDAEQGYVLTNHHVIDGADEISITLKDRRRLPAELLGSDPQTDIAVLKVEPANLTALELGDSDDLKVGDFVVAIGNPFGLGQTVTSGIVSALGRSGINPEGFEDFIQTDASINPGNSGGALITLTGQVIGINTAIIAPAGGNVGIGFAVPSNMARAVMDQIIEFGEVRRGRLGVIIQDLTPELAEALEVGVTQGAVVTQVEEGSAADKAGIEAGDVITEVNGAVVEGSADLRAKIGVLPFGEPVRLLVLRDGERSQITAQLGRPTTVSARDGQAVSKFAGVSLRELAPGMPLFGKFDGILVAEVDPRSPAARRGLRPGDVITGVNNKPVDSVAAFEAAVAASSGDVVALNIVRGNVRLFLVV